jgi:hypothetical protein
MATVFYDKAAVSVDWGAAGETLLASDFTVNLSSSQQPLYAIGGKGSLGQFPSAARVGDASFNFITTITGQNYGQDGNIINFLASGIKNSVGSQSSGVIISGAGVYGVGFLNSYSFNVASNTLSTSSASFTFYGSATQDVLSGRLGDSTAKIGVGSTTSPRLGTGIAHGRYTPLTNLATTSPEAGTVFGADYSISFNHSPVYKLGQELPEITMYTTAQESINVTEDVFASGLKFNPDAADFTIELSGLATPAQAVSPGATPMTLTMISGKQVSTSMSAGLDDIVRTQKTLTAAY